MASFKCKDLGMKCGFEVKDENRDELMQMVAEHAERTHNMKPPFASDMQQAIQKAIKK